MTKTSSKSVTETWLDTLDLSDVPSRDGKHLRAIGAALSAVERADDALRQAVEEARAGGDSWEAIGPVLGTSRQGAHRKYGNRHRGEPD